MDLSIVIPIHNGEKYINRCLKSIERMTNIKYEIIIINDDSSDSTIEILKEKQKESNNIRVINLEENKGVSYCRNLGIQNATGKYIGFIDVDDYIENEMYEKLIEKAEKEHLDICCCNYFEINEKSNQKIKSKYKFKTCKIAQSKALDMYLTDKFSPAIWDKIFKTEKIKSKVKFNEDLSIGEDILFCLDAIIESENVGLINEYCYNYVQQDNSAMHTISQKLLQFNEINKIVSEDEKYKNIQEQHIQEYEYFLGEMIVRSIHSITSITNKENKSEAKRYLTFIKKEERYILKKFIFNIYTSKFIKLEISIFLIFGVSVHVFLAPIYKYMRNKIRK